MANFSDPDHMPDFLDEVLDAASNETRALCGDNPECIFDATETGNMEIGLETLQTNQENVNDQTVACKYGNIFNLTLGRKWSTYTLRLLSCKSQVRHAKLI